MSGRIKGEKERARDDARYRIFQGDFNAILRSHKDEVYVSQSLDGGREGRKWRARARDGDA